MCEIPLTEQQIQAEFEKLNAALSRATTPQQKWLCLLAIRTALDWMKCGSVSPYDAIMSGQIERDCWTYLQVLAQIEAKRLMQK